MMDIHNATVLGKGVFDSCDLRYHWGPVENSMSYMSGVVTQGMSARLGRCSKAATTIL
jgi:hypothetical protein